ncbi:hypothetical protein [Roseibium sp.]|uniref:hypothetical protein n=1 Tax=Roseibium sp. TaxID=1936156 RepID=UPI0032796840
MIEAASLKFIIPFAVATTLALPAAAQDLGSALLMGLGSTALDKGSDMLKRAPEDFEQFMQNTEAGRSYASDAACLGELQVGINAGSILANMLPFSTVKAFEDGRGPVGRFRLMLNGEKNHFEISCDGPQMVSAPLLWGDAPDQRNPAARSSFDAGVGLLLLLHLQGAFEEEVPTPVARTDKEEVDVDALIADFQRERKAEELSDAEKARRDVIIDRAYADKGLERLSEDESDVMETDDLIADALAEALGKPGEPESTSGEPRPKPRSGPPLSKGEKYSFAQEITACWNIGVLSTEAAATTVVVALAMNPDATPIASSIRLLGHEGGSEAAARQAFEATKRAIIRCGSRGYDLPSEKLASDGTMIITFDPGRTTSATGITVRQIIGH